MSKWKTSSRHGRVRRRAILPGPLPPDAHKPPTTFLNSAPPASVDGAIDALVIERAQHRAELVAERALWPGRAAGVVGFVVLPSLDDGEVVRAARLLHHLEAHITVALAARIRQRIEYCDQLVLARRGHVDMARHEHRALRRHRIARTDIERIVHALVIGRVLDRLELVAERARAG